MKNIYIPYRCRRRNRGAILVLMLILAALTGLLATSNLERTRQRTLLDDALTTRAQAEDVLKQTLHQGLVYANEQLRIEDFDISQRGIYKAVMAQRLDSDYRRFARPVPSPISGVDTGYWVELFSEGPFVQTARSKFYLSCRLLISAYAEGPGVPLLFSQALVETALPTFDMPTTDTKVLKVTAQPEAKVVATRIFN